MTLPLEINFWNMPPEPCIEAAAQNELLSLEPGNSITSCRVKVTRSETGLHHSSYAVQIVVLAGPKMLRFEGDSTWSRILRHAGDLGSKKGEPDTVETALHRAFTNIHAQLG